LSADDKNLSKTVQEKEPGSAPLRRAATILDAVAAAREGVPLQHICDAVGLPVSTTHRLLQSLLAIGYLAFDAERKRYRIGSRLVRLVHISQDTATIKMQADPLLTALANRFRQTAFLTQLVGEELELVTYALPDEPLGSAIYPGGRFPIHATATGKATFAFQPEAVVDRLLRRPLEKLQPATLADPEAVRRELETVRQLGYAVIDSEFDPGVFAIGCPVISASGSVTFAVALVGLGENMRNDHTIEAYAAALKATARDLATLIARA